MVVVVIAIVAVIGGGGGIAIVYMVLVVVVAMEDSGGGVFVVSDHFPFVSSSVCCRVNCEEISKEELRGITISGKCAQQLTE